MEVGVVTNAATPGTSWGGSVATVTSGRHGGSQDTAEVDCVGWGHGPH